MVNLNGIYDLLISLPGIVLALSFHEFAHAQVSDWLGDRTPRLTGRLTLEPWAHLDLIGTLMLVFFGFGWAKPVPIDPYNYTNPRRGVFLVSLAGPAMNLILAFLLAFPVALGWGWFGPGTGSIIYRMLQSAFFINVALAVFNLIPLPPLDGSKIVAALLPEGQLNLFEQLEAYGPILLMFLLITNIIGRIVGPATNSVVAFLVTAVSAITGVH